MDLKVKFLFLIDAECTCAPGPCTCGYSPVPNNNAYILPVRYNNGDNYALYEAPQEESNRYLHRVTRQTSTADPSILEHLRNVAAAIRERAAARFAPAAERVGSALTALRTNADQPPRPSLRERISTLAEPIVSMVRDSMASTRSKRDTTGPVLRVKEYNPLNEQTRYSKYMNRHLARVELPAPEQRETDIEEMEKASRCHSCGTKLTSSVCSHCGTYQPQYVEFIEGKQVPFYPGAVQPENQQSMTNGPTTRYIFDRYGHKYLENNGKLRLVRSQPDYATLAGIYQQNRDIIEQLNQSPGRLMAQPVDVVADLTKMVREMSREPRHSSNLESKNQEKRSTTADSPRSMYQVLPMQYDGQDSKLIVKVYDNKHEMDQTNNDEKLNDEHHETEMSTDDSTNTMEKTSSPTVQQFAKKDKKFEVITFDNHKGTPDEEIRRILEYLHPKQMW